VRPDPKHHSVERAASSVVVRLNQTPQSATDATRLRTRTLPGDRIVASCLLNHDLALHPAKVDLRSGM
jgi:hypothetical protein